MEDVPDSHPRASSLAYRHRISDGIKKKIVTMTGMVAHGRGEAFDYLIGEKTPEAAIRAMEAAVALLMTAEHAVISINGNTAVLVPEETVALAEAVGAKMEINIFYQEPGRLEAIEKAMRDAGAKELLGTKDAERVELKGFESNRRVVDPEGIKIADVVLVPLEDGDRTEALVKMGKTVITIDLNPLSRTAQKSQVSIVDNIVRSYPKMIEIARTYKEKGLTPEELKSIAEAYDNKAILAEALETIIKFLENQL